MATRTKKTVTTSLPQEELAALDRVREQQNLTRSQALREAVRWYIGAMADCRRRKTPCPTRSRPCAGPKRSSREARPSASKTYSMSWDFQLADAAQRALRSMPEKDRARINRALNEMKTDPFSGDVVPLKGEYKGLLRRRVGDRLLAAPAYGFLRTLANCSAGSI